MPIDRSFPRICQLSDLYNATYGTAWYQFWTPVLPFSLSSKNEKKSNLKRCLPFTVDLRGEHLARRPPSALHYPTHQCFKDLVAAIYTYLYLGPMSFWLDGATMMYQFGSTNDFDAVCTQVSNLGELTPSGLGLLNWGQGTGGRRSVGGTTIIVI